MTTTTIIRTNNMINGPEMRCVLCPAPGIFFKHIFLHLLIIYYQLNYDDNKVKDEGIECMRDG